MVDECQQWTFAGVERHEIEVVEDPWLLQGAQLSIAITAAQYRDDGRVHLLDGLRDPKRAVDIARKGRGDEHQGRLMRRQHVERQCVQNCVDQIVWRIERRLQLIEPRLARRQRFRITHELKARIDGVANDVGEVIEIQGGDVLGTILQSECTKGPVESVVFLRERREARTFRQKVPRRNTMSETGVSALQKPNGRLDGGAVGLEVPGEKARGFRVLLAGQLAQPSVNGPQALRRQQLKCQGDGEICLFCVEPARAQEPGEIRRGGIRRVELGHWRDD